METSCTVQRYQIASNEMLDASSWETQRCWMILDAFKVVIQARSDEQSQKERQRRQMMTEDWVNRKRRPHNKVDQSHISEM